MITHRLKTKPSTEGSAPVDWALSTRPVDYEGAVRFMERRVQEIFSGQAREMVWLLEHPPLFTAGTSAKPEDLLWPDRFPVYKTGRGGQFTYHGPGQRVVYVMLDVKQRTGDVRSFVGLLEAWIIAALDRFGIVGETRSDRVGVWVRRPDMDKAREDKVAAIGIRVRKWTSFHGISINVAPELGHFAGIVPCGVVEHGVTSLAELGRQPDLGAAGDAGGKSEHQLMAMLDRVLAETFEAMVGPIVQATEPEIT